jgi:shikimate kinase
MLDSKNSNQAILPLLQKRSIVFVGMMGSGKSAIGKLVGRMLELPYFDADAEITAAAGMSIADIFEQFGEDDFRKGEMRVVSRLLADGPSVLSLGGGAFINDETRALVGKKAISVWLKADIDLLMSRVLRRPKSRPLLRNPDPRAVMKQLMDIRSPIYALADIHVESSPASSKTDTANDVMTHLEIWLRQHATAGITLDEK